MPEFTDGDGFSHIAPDGSAHMVDVSAKAITARAATAVATVRTTAEVCERLRAGDLPKGEALGVARVAGILAAKRTPELIPLCHSLPLDAVNVDLVVGDDSVSITAQARTAARTGVEMEALTAASVAALTLYDMIKAVDKHPVIDGVRVVAKSGGRSGDWAADGWAGQ